jgi:hypothetical protein
MYHPLQQSKRRLHTPAANVRLNTTAGAGGPRDEQPRSVVSHDKEHRIHSAHGDRESLTPISSDANSVAERPAVDFVQPCVGWLPRIKRLFHRSREILVGEGFLALAVKSTRKLLRVLRRRLGIDSGGRKGNVATPQDNLIRSIVSFTASKQVRNGRRACRSLTETEHLLGQYCQRCLHFEDSTCALMKSGVWRASPPAFVSSLVQNEGACPIGAWPPRAVAPITRMNLVYFIYPLKHPDNMWQWNVAELLKRIHVFNGRKIVTVATAEHGSFADKMRVDPPEAVVEALSGHDIEFRFAPNDPTCGEAQHFLPAMRMLASTNPSEAVFYAHAKGVTRPKSQLDVIQRWTLEMYQHNLDRIDEVRQLLPRWPCVGIAKSYGYPEAFRLGNQPQLASDGNNPWHGWHFAGTFWWVRHDALFSRPDWDQIEIFPHATERYLANFFRSDEAVCLAHEDMVQPYDMACWQRAAA